MSEKAAWEAMTDPIANGQRFLATSDESISLLDIANILRSEFGDKAVREQILDQHAPVGVP